MKKLIVYWMSLLLVALPSLSASASAGKDAHRLRNSGTVLKETLVCKFPPELFFLLNAFHTARVRLDRPLLLSRVSASLR
jgi:hypothetical protein